MTTGVLRLASISYLLLPNMLFAAAWFRLPISLLMVVGLLYLWSQEFKKRDMSGRLSSGDILFLLVFVAIWLFFSGVGGMSSQTRDWFPHNSKFYDLYQNSWPTYFSEVGQYAVHYFGYYLVPAGLSKIAGKLLPEILVVWTALGFFLGASWIYLLLHRNRFLLLLFLFLRGTGLLIVTILTKLGMDKVVVPIINPSLRSIFDQSTFVPNQLIAVLITFGILFYDRLLLGKVASSFFVITLSFIWGIFPAIAMLVVFAFFFFEKYGTKANYKSLFVGESVVMYLLPGIVFVPTFLYLLSSQNTPANGLLWSFGPMETITLLYVTGIICDLLLFYLLAILFLRKGSAELHVVRFLLGMLLLVSLFSMGKFNDSFFRASMVFFIGILVLILRKVHNRWVAGQLSTKLLVNPVIVIVAFLMFLGVGAKAYLLRDNIIVAHFLPERSRMIRYSYDAYPNVYQALKEGCKDEQLASQYLGAKNSFYAKYLSRK